jgi:poly(3-hydroxybutyrate) depolymerase
MLYNILDWQRRALHAQFNLVSVAVMMEANVVHMAKMMTPFPAAFDRFEKSLTATAEITGRIAHDGGKPSFNLPSTSIAGKNVAVREEVVTEKAFGNLVHFKRDTNRNDPKILLVAPMSGHYATLLRDTVRDLLPSHDVYITDWKNARDVPVSAGDFSLEDYIDYVRDFMKDIGPGAHIAGLSQSTVPVLAVTALLAEENSPYQPVTMTLAGGPIDARIKPTAVDKMASQNSMGSFKMMISQVPSSYAGRGRSVYPGLVQIFNLVSAAPEKHAQAYASLHKFISDGNETEAQKIRDARNEYEAVSDSTVTFYLDTISEVFHKFSLARGEMTWKGRKVDLSKINNTALLTLEGEKDDICAPGQTLVAHMLCKNIKAGRHFANIEKGAGHYELLNGPRIAGFIRTVASQAGIAYDAPTENTAIAPTSLYPGQVKAYLGVPVAANDLHNKGIPALQA